MAVHPSSTHDRGESMGYLYRLLSRVLDGSGESGAGPSHGERPAGDGSLGGCYSASDTGTSCASKSDMSKEKTPDTAALASYIDTDPAVREAVRAILDCGYGYRVWWHKVEAVNGTCYVIRVQPYGVDGYHDIPYKDDKRLSAKYLWTPSDS